MSRIGKKVISIPEKTAVALQNGVLTVTGPLGALSKFFKPEISVTVADGTVTLAPKSATGTSVALWGTYASHVMNMIAGVTTPYVKKLIIEGIGYKSEVKGTNLVMALGFSHPVSIAIP